MKINRAALILVLLVVCSFPVFSNQDNCEGTREFIFGVDDAETTDLPWLWGGIGTIVAIALPLAIKPRPKVIPDYVSEEKHNCYLEGYGWKARRRSVIGASIGCGVGWGLTLITVFPLLIVAKVIGEGL